MAICGKSLGSYDYHRNLLKSAAFLVAAISQIRADLCKYLYRLATSFAGRAEGVQENPRRGGTISQLRWN